MKARHILRPAMLLAAGGVLLSGCAPEMTKLDFPTIPTKDAAAAAAVSEQFVGNKSDIGKTGIAAGPPVPGTATSAVGSEGKKPHLSGPPVTLSVEQMPLPTFINTVLGDTLGLNFVVDPRVASRTDLVTMRTPGQRDRNEVLALTLEVLRNYGIQMGFEDDKTIRIVPNETLAAEAPQVIRGRTAPSLTAALRPVYQYVEVSHIGAGEMSNWLLSAFGQKLKVTPAVQSNAILMLGLPEDVTAAVEAVHVLDQPRLAGRKSVRIEPIFWTARNMADKLSDILRAEGYNVGDGSQGVSAITLLPMEPSNSILAFAGDMDVLNHLSKWAADLDQPAKSDPRHNVFFYAVRNTTADSLGSVLNSVLNGTSPSDNESSSNARPGNNTGQNLPGGTPPASPAQRVNSNSNSRNEASSTANENRFVVDTARNGLIFLGDARTYAEIRPLMENLDRPPKEALIEVTVAEVTLTDNSDLGVEFSATTGNTSTFSTSGGLNIGTGGFNYTFMNGSGSIKATLNALADNHHVTVLSTPRLLARSGSEAKIEVGTQVPILTSQQSSNIETGGSTGILQSVEYRDTGVILTVKPVIYAGNQIDLDVAQEVSAAETNSTSSVGSPAISNRKVSTQLSLRDGATVLLGGMIQTDNDYESTGIPYLKDIPGLGLLFKNQNLQKTRTELLIFITPYIAQSGEDLNEITQTFRTQMGSWVVAPTELSW